MKIDTKSIINQYDKNFEHYKNLSEKVDFLIKKTIQNNGIKTHSISHRIKKTASILEKIRKNKYDRPFEKINDIVGFRIVCLFLNDIEAIKKILVDKFNVFEVDDKVNPSEKNIFGYMSLHLKCKLIPEEIESSFNEIYDLTFEIQIRTIAQDAWASISHYLDYKKESIIPEELRRDFQALSGLFYVADTHFSFLNNEKAELFFKKP